MSKRHGKRIKLSQMFFSDKLNILKVHATEKFTWPLNHSYKVHVTKHQRHVIRKRRERKSICGRQNCQQTKKGKLSSHKRRWDDASGLSDRTTGRAGLSTVWPNAGGGRGTRRGSPTARNVSCTVGGLSVLAPTDWLASHQRTSTPRLWLPSDGLARSTPAESIPSQLNRL